MNAVRAVHDGDDDGERDAGLAVGALVFAEFYAESFNKIAEALALTLGDDGLASEATAEAMTRAFERWKKVSRYDNPRGWVYRVGLNWARRRFRGTWREIVTNAPPDSGVTPSTGADPELATALQKLTEQQRSVVVLRYLFDWSEAQTASALNISVGTAKSRLSRGLVRLAEIMELHDDD